MGRHHGRRHPGRRLLPPSAEITRPRTPADDLAAVAAIKAHRTLTAYNWLTDSIEREPHYIVYDSPAVF